MAAQAADPIVQIINGNEENVGAGLVSEDCR